MRDELGLVPGTPLTLREEGSRIVLEARREEDTGGAELSRKGVLVWKGEAEQDLGGAVQRLRRDRLERVTRGRR